MKRNRPIDSINICGLRLKCHIGVPAKERAQEQIIMADVALKCDLEKAGKTDCLEDTVDYSVIAEKISSLAAKENFFLLEALAGRLAEVCLADPKIRSATVKVAKKGVRPHVQAVEVEITRKRE